MNSSSTDIEAIQNVAKFNEACCSTPELPIPVLIGNVNFRAGLKFVYLRQHATLLDQLTSCRDDLQLKLKSTTTKPDVKLLTAGKYLSVFFEYVRLLKPADEVVCGKDKIKFEWHTNIANVGTTFRSSSVTYELMMILFLKVRTTHFLLTPQPNSLMSCRQYYIKS